MSYRVNAAVTFFTILAPVLFRIDQDALRHRKAIICLTYDDGLDSQLAVALPQLDSAGIKATFFLNSIQGSSPSDVIGQAPEAVIGWTRAARHGHELGNHTLFHPCSEKIGWEHSVSIENYDLDRIITEITIQNSILALMDTARKSRSFAFPCNNTMVNEVDYGEVIANRGLVRFARTGGDSNSIITDFGKLNPMRVPSWHVWTGTTAGELIACAEKVRKAGGMGVYQFHGIGGQIFALSKEAHRSFLQFLRSHPDDYLVLTFSDAMQLIKSEQIADSHE